jgi:hypothetical protein
MAGAVRGALPAVFVLAGLLGGAGVTGHAATSEGGKGSSAPSAELKAAIAKRPAGMSAAEAQRLLESYAKDRAETQAWLKSSPTSYLATVQRRDFEGRRSLTVGSAADNDVRLDDSGIRPHHLRVTITGDSFRVETPDPAARFRVKDRAARSATVPASGIEVGRYQLRLSHQRFPAIIVFDPKSPRFKQYKGIRYFPPDLSYHVVATLSPNAKPDTIVILSTRGSRRHALRVGWFDFKVRGTPCRLEATRLLEPGVGESDFGLFFTDATTGNESYGVGRYLDAKPAPGGKYVLDFNFCYSPACAYSEHYNCPIPPQANRLKVAIRAGEMDPHYMH